MLADRRVQIMLNLAKPHFHYEYPSDAWASRHVYSEKVPATDFAEPKARIEIAEACGVRISATPRSLLGKRADYLEAVAGRPSRAPVARKAYAKW